MMVPSKVFCAVRTQLRRHWWLLCTLLLVLEGTELL